MRLTRNGNQGGPGRRVTPGLLLGCAVLCVGLVLRFWRFPALSLSYDELVTGAQYIGAPDVATFLCLINMYFPEQISLFGVIQYFWGSVFGPSITAVRLLPLLLNLAAFPVFYAVARRIFGRTAGLVALLCLSLSPMHIWWAQGARPYTMIPLCSAVFLYSFVAYWETRDWKWACAHLCMILVMLWISLTALFLVGAELCFVAMLGRRRMKQTAGWILAVLFLCVPTLLWIRWMPHHASAGAGKPAPFVLLGAIIGNDSMLLNSDIPRPAGVMAVDNVGTWFNYALAGFFGLAIFWLVISTSRSWILQRKAGTAVSDAPGLERSIYLLLVILLPPFLVYGAAYFLARNLVFARYTLYTWPALYAAAGGFVAVLPRRWLRNAVIMLLLALYLYQIPGFLPTTWRADWIQAGAYVRKDATKDDVVLAMGEFLSGEVLEANMRLIGRPLHIPILTAATAQAAVDMAQRRLAADTAGGGGNGRAVWLLTQRGNYFSDVWQELADALGVLGLTCENHVVAGGDAILVSRITRKRDAAPVSVEPPVVADPNPDNRMDHDALLKQIFPAESGNTESNDAQIERYRPVFLRIATHMYRDPMDPMVWALNALVAGEPELAEAITSYALSAWPDYALTHLARALALTRLGNEEEASRELGQAYAKNPFMKRVFDPFMRAYLSGASAETLRGELDRFERMGSVWFTPAMWALYRARFEPEAPVMPPGLSAPRNACYEAWRAQETRILKELNTE